MASQNFASTTASALRMLPAEFAHNMTIKAMRSPRLTRLVSPPKYEPELDLSCDLPGVGKIAHPLGLAAGFDKNAEIIESSALLGFSFIELGTVTPRPQPGNNKPRLFRIKNQASLINRMGFNSCGANKFERNLKSHQSSRSTNLRLGVSLGKNKTTLEEVALLDFLEVRNLVGRHCDFLVVNLSSPNTPGLRDLAKHDFLVDLAHQLSEDLSRTWIKLDPDRSRKEFSEIIDLISRLNFAGVVLTNTHFTEYPHTGGLSGAGLAAIASSHLEIAHSVHQGSLPMIAVGGISSGFDLFERISRGACAAQIYSSLIYRGPWAVSFILKELEFEMKKRGISCIDQFKGSYYR